MKAIVYAVVLSYNDCQSVRRCLDSLMASTYPNLHVLLVDNASTDGTQEMVRKEFPGCGVVLNTVNLGFAGGCNIGIEAAVREDAEFVLLLNQDTLVSPDMTGKLVACMRSHPQAGIVGPKTLSQQPMPDGSQRLLYAGAWRGILPLRQKVPGIERSDSDRTGPPLRVDYVWGHGMMIRARALPASGMFDPDFFMYFEDLDLCRRMKNAGFQILCEPSAVMWHDAYDGARAKVSEYWRWAHKARSTRVFLGKHYSPLTAKAQMVLTVLAEAQQLLRHGRLTALVHLLTAHLRAMLGR